MSSSLPNPYAGRNALKTSRATLAKELLPEAVTVLGVPTLLYLENPNTRETYEFRPRPATVLCADEDGREMYLLAPIRDAGRPKHLDRALKAERLWEEFTNRHSDGLYNCFVPAFRKPMYRGRIILMRYLARKDLDEESEGHETEWEHYFEAPDYPDLWFVGRNQYFIPRGHWRITDAGIGHHDDH